ncbi:protein-disulfide reductase DsbD domain-containing protein [Minwuia sp.]|uniref:protein-disulfide reductase DsbD domain-containing protein n=1 Tax=Minwuia sp. TaxID=2493630 RepID=UPI003A8FF5A1
MKIRFLLAALCGVLAASSAAQATDFASPWGGIQEAEVRLVAGHVPGHGDMLGLQFVMSPGWKVYWRSPGDAGFPPVPEWEGTSGATDMEIRWPLPLRFVFYGLETYGYEDEAILPITFQREGGAASVKLELFYAACADICVPVTTSLALDLPAGGWPENRHARSIGTALSKVPVQDKDIASIESVRETLNAGRAVVEIRIQTDRPVVRPDLIVEGPKDLLFERPACTTAGTTTSCAIAVAENRGGGSLAGKDLVLTLSGEGFAAEMPASVARP